MSTLTPHLALRKLEYQDHDYPDWGTVENENMDILDLAFGNLIYTEDNYVTSSAHAHPITVIESQSLSLDKLDIALKQVNANITTSDQILALDGEGTPSVSNLYVTKEFVRPNRKRVMFPEGAGSVLNPSGTGFNLGNMTTTSGVSGDYIYSYYQWLSDDPTQIQSYDISIQWRTPATFLGFSTATNKALIVDICTLENATTNNKVDVIIKKDGTATTSTIVNKCSTVAATWYSERELNEIIGFDASNTVLASLSAGDTLNITIRVYSKNSKYAKIGAVTIQYMG